MSIPYRRSPDRFRLMVPEGFLGPLVIPPATIFLDVEDDIRTGPAFPGLLRPVPPSGLPPQAPPPILPMQGPLQVPLQVPQRAKRQPGVRVVRRPRRR